MDNDIIKNPEEQTLQAPSQGAQPAEEKPAISSYEDMVRSFQPDPTKDMTAAAHEARQYTALFAMADAMSHMANMVGTAHGAAPMQLSSATAEHDARYQQLLDSLRKRRESFDKGVFDARMQDMAEQIRRDERERQEALQQQRILQEQQYRSEEAEKSRQQQSQMQQGQQQFQADQQEKRLAAGAASDIAAQNARTQKEEEKASAAKTEAEANANAYMESFFDSRNVADYNAAMKISPTVARAALKKWNDEHPDDQISLREKKPVSAADAARIRDLIRNYKKKGKLEDYEEAVRLNKEYAEEVMKTQGISAPATAQGNSSTAPSPAPATTSADTTPVIDVDEFKKYEF